MWVRFPLGLPKEYIYNIMKLVYGHYGYENLAPERMIGFYWDINHDGSWVAAFCLWKWYIGIEVKSDDESKRR